MGRRAALAACGGAFVHAVALAQEDPRAGRSELPRRDQLGERPLDLGGLPTPVRALTARADLWLKDDGQAGAVFGGSKARKLEWLLADALSAGARGVVTCGAPASNHMLATAVHARRVGLACELFVLPGPRGPTAGAHLRAAQALGARLRVGRRADRDGLAQGRLPARAMPGAHPLPLGGSSLRGNLGYYTAATELERQVEAGELPEPRTIVVAAGTGGAAAGLLAGLSYTELSSRVVAVRTASRRHVSEGAIRAEAEAISDFISCRHGLAPGRLRIDHAQAAPGYGRSNRRSRRALHVAAAEGLTLDPTYSAKAFAAALDLPSREGPTLFWNTFDPRRPAHPPLAVRDLPAALRGYARDDR